MDMEGKVDLVVCIDLIMDVHRRADVCRREPPCPEGFDLAHVRVAGAVALKNVDIHLDGVYHKVLPVNYILCREILEAGK